MTNENTKAVCSIVRKSNVRMFVILYLFGIKTFRGDGSLEGWIRRILINEALAYIRKNKVMKFSVDIEDAEYVTAGNNQTRENINTKDLLKMIQQLPTGFRTVFNLYAIEGYSHKEIAEMLGISEGTSKSQYARARAHLQKKLQAEKQTEKYYEEHH